MASYAQGATVSFGGGSFSEVTNISVSGAAATIVDVTGRDTGLVKIYEVGDVDLGSVSVECLAGGLGTGDLGTKAALSISGGGISWSGQAIFESLEFSATVGDIVRVTYKFRMSGGS